MRSGVAALLIFFVSCCSGCAEKSQANRYAYVANSANSGAPVDAHIDFLEERLQTRPQAWMEQAELASYYLERAREGGPAEDFEKARQWAEASMNAFPSAAGRLVTADILQTEHKFPESLELLDNVLTEEPENLTARMLAIKVLLAQGKAEEAAQHAQLLPEQPLMGLAFARGRVEEARGNVSEARSLYASAMSLEQQSGSPRDSAMLRAVWARLEMENGNLEAAHSLQESAKGISVGLPILELVRGELARRQERFQEAARIYRDGFALYHDPLFLLRLAEIQNMEGDEKRSKETLESAVEIMGKNAFGHERDLAEALLQLDAEGNAENIRALMRKELERRQDKETLRIKRAVEKKLGTL